MTKPKSIKALLTEANKLARERGGYALVAKVGRTCSASFHLATEISIIVWAGTVEQALRCLIAALREVPILKARKR